MSIEIEELKYPVGRYQKPATYEQQDIKEWMSVLAALPSWMDACIENLDQYQLATAYREGGWTVQQVVHHVADSHMNAYIRLKLALTEENPVIKPYAEQLWAELADNKFVPVNVSVTMLQTIHRRMLAVLEHMQPHEWERCYFHPEHQRNVPIWEMVAMYAWHSTHHTEHIRRLRERENW